jgi:hypothetical protein
MSLLFVPTVGGTILVLGQGYSRFRDCERSWAACRHGVSGGKTRHHHCGPCRREQREIENKSRREMELRRRQRDIDRAVPELQAAERSRLARLTVPTLEDLRRLSPRHFEGEVAQMFKRLGYSVQQTPYVKDHGRDAILRKNDQKLLLECEKIRKGWIVRPSRPDAVLRSHDT